MVQNYGYSMSFEQVYFINRNKFANSNEERKVEFADASITKKADRN